MRSRYISRLVRRVVGLHASIVLPVLVACSGKVASSTLLVDGGGEAGDGGGDGNDTCTVLSSTPLYQTEDASCYSLVFPISGTAAQCMTNGGLSQAECETLCPPAQDVGDASVGLESCRVGDCNALLGPGKCPTPNALMCIYAGCVGGRRPAGLGRCRLRGTIQPVARFLARAAYLEAASVDAFERLARELAAHGAPRRLCQAALRAARDERMHARVVGEWAARAGARPSRPRVAPWRARSLEAIARENAVEGCVRETFGAAVAMAQATNLSHAGMRAAMRRIALDEMRHAQLAWAVARWIEPRLATSSRARVDRARRAAARSLLDEVSRSPDPSLVRELGVPTATQARAIATDLDAALWLEGPGFLVAPGSAPRDFSETTPGTSARNGASPGSPSRRAARQRRRA
jgi:hypothetical protein